MPLMDRTAKSCGRAATRSRRGIIGAGSRSQMDASTLGHTTAPSIVSACVSNTRRSFSGEKTDSFRHHLFRIHLHEYGGCSTRRSGVADEQCGCTTLLVDSNRRKNLKREHAEAGFPIPLENETRQRGEAIELFDAAGAA